MPFLSETYSRTSSSGSAEVQTSSSRLSFVDSFSVIQQLPISSEILASDDWKGNDLLLIDLPRVRVSAWNSAVRT